MTGHMITALDHFHRWNVASLEVEEPEGLIALDDRETHELTGLTLSVTGGTGFDDPPTSDVVALRAPNLQQLHLSEVGLVRESFTFTRLSSLRLRQAHLPPVSQFLSVLRQNRSLRVLELSNCDFDAEDEADEASSGAFQGPSLARLDLLTTLRVSYLIDVGWKVLAGLETPNCRHYKLADDSEPTHEAFSEAFARG